MTNILNGYDDEDIEPFIMEALKIVVRDQHGHRPQSYEVRFDQIWVPGYFKEVDHNGWIEYEIADVLQRWLDRNTASEYFIMMDRGDFGEGPPIGCIDFLSEDEARAFVARFNHLVDSWTLTDSGLNKLLLNRPC